VFLGNHRLGFLVQADADIQRSIALVHPPSAAAIRDGDCFRVANDDLNLAEVKNPRFAF
jgi:hypothetical protein